MIRTLLAVAVFLALLLAIPYWAPDGFSQLPLPMVFLLGVAAVVAFLVGRRRRAKGWGTSSSEQGRPD